MSRGGATKRAAADAEAQAKVDAAKKAEAEAAAAAEAEAQAKADAEGGGDDSPTPPADDPKVIDGTGGGSKGGPPPAPAAPPAPAPARARKKEFPYQVAEGKSISCARGVLGPGEEITARYLTRTPKDRATAQEDLDKLVEGGFVVKAPSEEDDKDGDKAETE